ncbi:hypothetical protein [Clostridium chrysemydis]|uniref:hypothetical protein n=1 Tax=Clostridium chrysemydis TaxID=2665504 RepID=UPI001883E536|nr:hypothetical protein [Clostridium chrysemydis]
MKKIIIALLIILSTILLFNYVKKADKTIYGNNDKEILEALNSDEMLGGISKSNIKLLDTLNIEDTKVTGFYSDRASGYISFEKNELNDYVFKEASAYENQGDEFETRCHALPFYNKNSYILSLIFIKNVNDNIRYAEVLVNNEKPIKIDFKDKPMTLVDINSKGESSSITVKYFDKDYKLVKEG